MTDQTEYIEVGANKILNLDAEEVGKYIAFLSDKTIKSQDHSLKIELDIQFPIIRRLNTDTFLIADSRAENSPNGHVYNFNGQLILSFNAGDGIEDILVHSNKIIISYFDEGVYGMDGPNNDGLSVFNFRGQQLWGFNSSKSGQAIDDCYCLCKQDENKVLLYAYSALQVSELNLDSFKTEPFVTPPDFSGAHAISCTPDKIILHSSYKDKRSFFSWDRNKNLVTRFGDYSAPLRGIGNGKFLTFGDSGYTIIDPSI